MADRAPRDNGTAAFYSALADDDPEELYDNAPCAYLSALPDGMEPQAHQRCARRGCTAGDTVQRERGAAGVAEQRRVEPGGGNRPVQRGMHDRVGGEQRQHTRLIGSLKSGKIRVS